MAIPSAILVSGPKLDEGSRIYLWHQSRWKLCWTGKAHQKFLLNIPLALI